MSTDQGASAKADRATQASPEPASGLGQSVSVPCAFTPGPWHTNGDGIVRHDGPAGVFGVKLGSSWIEEAWSYSDADEETLANARLIAAAPELFEACRLFAEEYDAGDQKNGVALMLTYNRALEAAKNALAKARGQ